MTSTEYLLWLVGMAILIPAIVHGGTTWAYFRGSRETPSRPTGDSGSSSALRIADDGGATG
jgi:hypothetical protein